MSDYLKHIQAIVTNTRIARPFSFADLEVQKTVHKDLFDQLEVHRIQVVHGYEAHIPMYRTERERMIEHHKRLFLKQLSHVIYGDARKILFDLERAVYNQDWEDARKVLLELNKEMYP